MGKARLGVVYFNLKGAEELKRYLSKIRNYYVDISDSGNARLSKSAAHAFLIYVRNAFLTGKYQGRVPALHPVYRSWKHSSIYSGRPKGVLTQEMVDCFEVFRSRAGGDAKRRGHVVAIKEREHSIPMLRLEQFTKGHSSAKRTQPPRPIFGYALRDFLAEEFPGILQDFRFKRYVSTGLFGG